MKVLRIDIKNFRRLKKCKIDLSGNTTLFVGANNSGKTSTMDALAKFMTERKFVFNDITISNRIFLNKMGETYIRTRIIRNYLRNVLEGYCLAINFSHCDPTSNML